MMDTSGDSSLARFVVAPTSPSASSVLSESLPATTSVLNDADNQGKGGEQTRTAPLSAVDDAPDVGVPIPPEIVEILTLVDKNPKLSCSPNFWLGRRRNDYVTTDDV